MKLKNLFQDFNPSKFLVFLCLLLFALFYALKLDATTEWSYWLVFLPLWIWKGVVLSGALVGSYVWWRNPQYRGDGESYIQYKAMVISSGIHLLLLMFELLACDKLESGRHKWTLVFIPLLFMSLISIGVCVWAVKHERSFELELFSAVNILQYIFMALKFDGIVQWNFVIVFIPVWIVMCVALIGVLCAVILAIIHLKSSDIVPEQRRGNLSTAIGYTFLVLPLLIFLILLSNHLDGDHQFPYIGIAIPLFVSLTTLICMAFTAKGGNQWWFGLRKDFCQFLLNTCPLLQEYGNIAYSIHTNSADPEHNSEARKNKNKHSHKEPCEEQPRVVAPVISIETPD